MAVGSRRNLEESIKEGLAGYAPRAVETAIARVSAFLGTELLPQTMGAAVFARAGERPLFLPLQFRAPLPAFLAVDSAPHIYPLVELMDTYHRYIVVLSTTGTRVRIMTVHLGSIVEDVSAALPEQQHARDREWTKEDFRNHNRDRIAQFIKEQVRSLDRICSAGGYEHIVLAGNPRFTAQISRALPAQLAAKVIDVIPASEFDRTKEVVEATLNAFVEREEQESLAKVDKLIQETGRNGFAVTGAGPSLTALLGGQVDVLVMAKGFRPASGWGCDECGSIHAEAPIPQACPDCGARRLRQRDLKEDLVRLAELTGSGVEIVNHSDALMKMGGVGCLLRFGRPKSYGARAA